MKRVWSKPKLISLYRGKPEEAVLGNCKTEALYPGPTGGGDCVGSPPGGQCQTIGGS